MRVLNKYPPHLTFSLTVNQRTHPAMTINLRQRAHAIATVPYKLVSASHYHTLYCRDYRKRAHPEPEPISKGFPHMQVSNKQFFM